jgi:hypothetical protein
VLKMQIDDKSLENSTIYACYPFAS